MTRSTRTLTIIGTATAAAVLTLSGCTGNGDSPEQAAETFATAWNHGDSAKDCVTMMTGSDADDHTATDMHDCLAKVDGFTLDDSLEVFETKDLADGKGVVVGHPGQGGFAVYVTEAEDGWTPREYVVLTDGERAAGEGIPRLEGEVQAS